MGYYERFRETRLRIEQPADGKRLVYHAGALPDLHVLAPGLLLDLIAEIPVWEEKNRLAGRDRIHDFYGVAGGAEDIRLGFHIDRGVDVAYDDVAGIAALEFADGLDRAAFNQTAAGIFIGHDHDARRIEDLRCFRHKPDATKGDDIAFGL